MEIYCRIEWVRARATMRIYLVTSLAQSSVCDMHSKWTVLNECIVWLWGEGGAPAAVHSFYDSFSMHKMYLLLGIDRRIRKIAWKLNLPSTSSPPSPSLFVESSERNHCDCDNISPPFSSTRSFWDEIHAITFLNYCHQFNSLVLCDIFRRRGRNERAQLFFLFRCEIQLRGRRTQYSHVHRAYPSRDKKKQNTTMNEWSSTSNSGGKRGKKRQAIKCSRFENIVLAICSH